LPEFDGTPKSRKIRGEDEPEVVVAEGTVQNGLKARGPRRAFLRIVLGRSPK